MSFSIGSLLLGKGASGIAEGAKGITEAAEGIKTLFTGKLSPGKEADITIKLAGYISKIDQATQKVNEAEAQHPSIFVAGWRPFLGWILSFSVATYFIPKHLIAAYVWVYTFIATGELVAYPIGMGELLELVFGVLGMAGLRTIEKKYGVNKRH